MMPWLSQDEIDDLCKPLKQHAAQIRFLRELGLTVRTKPNGAPLVVRTHFEVVLNPQEKKPTPAAPRLNVEALMAYHTRTKPNWQALADRFSKKKRKPPA